MSSVDLPRVQLERHAHHPLVAAFLAWVARVGPFWAASLAGHLALFIVAALVLGTVHVAQRLIDTSGFEAVVDTVIPDSAPLVPLLVNERPLEPAPLDPPSPTLDDALNSIDLSSDSVLPPADLSAVFGKPNDPLGELSGSNNTNMLALIDVGNGERGLDVPGNVGDGPAARPGEIIGRGERFKTAPPGVTPQSKSAVLAALSWFGRHQGPDGGWSLGDYTRMCKDTTCTGAGKIKADSAATAFAVLPYLAAGFTHQIKSPYQKSIYGGLFWLVKHQANDGNLAAGSGSLMYSQGLATIALCEAFALSKDKQIGAAAQAAIKFIESAQNKDDGGWRYTRGQPGDTSVTGWQLMALKSGEMAGLAVNPKVIALGKKYLKSASGKSKQGGLFGYLPETAPSPTMTAVGLLCTQYLGAKRDDPALAEGEAYLMRILPNTNTRNSYYWYYGTLVMHNMPGAQWDKWNFAVRRVLIESQVKNGCAAGSWDPHKPAPDGHAAETGGRIMTTSLAALTLEVYYRYLPLYSLDKRDQAHRPAEAK